MRVVVLGGTGNFGARICRRLAQENGIEVIAAGRASGLDLNSSTFASALGALAPRVLIHCAGPYQGQDYRVAKAALACSAHYIDLADGREFVARFPQHVDSAARAAERVAIAGASTLPALSSAVIARVSALLQAMVRARMARVHRRARGVLPDGGEAGRSRSRLATQPQPPKQCAG